MSKTTTMSGADKVAAKMLAVAGFVALANGSRDAAANGAVAFSVTSPAKALAVVEAAKAAMLDTVTRYPAEGVKVTFAVKDLGDGTATLTIAVDMTAAYDAAVKAALGGAAVGAVAGTADDAGSLSAT